MTPQDIARAAKTHRDRQARADEALATRDRLLSKARAEGWSLAELARLTGLTTQAVSKAARGKS